MSSTQQTRPRTSCFLVLATLAGACGVATSQDFSLGVADTNPLGIGNFVPTRTQFLEETGGIESGIKGAFAAMVSLNTVYNSNFFLTENDPQSEVSLNLSPSLSYTTDPEGGAIWTFSANYQPSYRAYLDNSDLNNFDQSGNVQLNFQGARTSASIFASYSELSGTDRLTGNFTTGSLVAFGIQASREIAARTSINGGVSYSQSDYSSGVNKGSTSLGTSLGVLWRASDRTSVGSSMRYGRSESDNTGSRDSWALLGELRYRLGERIWLSASLGPQFSSNSGSGDNTVSVSGDISSRYAINERWSWVTSFRTATIPSPNDVGYIVNNYGFGTALERQLLRANVSGGIDFNYSQFEEVNAVTTPRDDEKNLSFYLTYSRSFFMDRVSAYSTVRYATNTGRKDWSQWQVSLGLGVPF